MKRYACALAAVLMFTSIGAPTLAQEAVQEQAQYADIARGDKGEAVQSLMQRLYDLGYYTSAVDNSFGPGMAKAVKLFNAQNGIEGGEKATAAMQQLAFSDQAQVYAVLPPVIKSVTLEEYEGKKVFSIDVYNPQESEIGFLSVIYRCYDAAGNEIFADSGDAANIGNAPKFAKYRDITVECGEQENLRKVTAFDLSAYKGVSRVEASLYCYTAGSNTVILPEKYFSWVSSDGTASGASANQAEIMAYNRTAEQDGLATRFMLGADIKYIFGYESAHYGLPCGWYVTGLTPDGYCAGAGLQVGDVITAISGVQLDFEEALYIIKAQMQPGTQYELKYVRGGQEYTALITWTEQ